MDNRTEQLADGVWRVEVGFMLNAYVLANDGRSDAEGLTLVDTGTVAGGPRLVRSIRMLGLDPRASTTALITHWHSDHAGSAGRFARSSAGTTILVGEEDLPVVAGQRPPAPLGGRPTRLAARLLRRPPAAPTATSLEATIHAVTGGSEVLDTPGHTFGHRSVWLPDRGVLLAGDAVLNVLRLVASPRLVSADWPSAVHSVRRLAELPVGVLAPGHGPPVVRRAQQRLAALADRLA